MMMVPVVMYSTVANVFQIEVMKFRIAPIVDTNLCISANDFCQSFIMQPRLLATFFFKIVILLLLAAE